MYKRQVEVNELPNMYETILNLIPANPFESLTSGEMMQIIVFSLCLGFAIITIGEKAKPLTDVISLCSQAMFKIIDMIIGIIPYGVFGLMTVAMAKYGVAIFGPVLKFIATDYLAGILMSVVGYGLLLSLIGKVNPITFWKKAFEPWLIAFSTCTSAAALPVSMEAVSYTHLFLGSLAGIFFAFHMTDILDAMIIFNYPYMGSLLIPLLGGLVWREPPGDVYKRQQSRYRRIPPAST